MDREQDYQPQQDERRDRIQERRNRSPACAAAPPPPVVQLRLVVPLPAVALSIRLRGGLDRALRISRDSRHKRRETGGKRSQYRKKRKFELGRQPANTKLAAKRVHTVRVRGGHLKFRALRLDTGNFSWGTEVSARKTRILDVVYNASNNELVRTKTLVKNSVVLVDATPFRQWYEAHYGVKIGVKKNAEKVEEEDVKKSDHVVRKLASRQRTRVLDQKLDEQFMSGRLLAVISSRPGQSGRADGYILEGKELEFYQRKLATKKSKK